MNNFIAFTFVGMAIALTGCAVTEKVQPKWHIPGETSEAYMNSIEYCLNRTHIIVGNVGSAHYEDRFQASMNSCMGSRGWSNAEPVSVKPFNEPVTYRAIESRKL